ncbi:ABC transporter permease subunit [Pokkaliibacter sp. MBI-7]|uniref:ABC transporter permease n=1 Tax=Pokkaliibacter sp. MBI-7 TaxID=3040600 RepID=UPI002446B8AF|nr:ABC transporter permease subunit [Pokkaliibacter sp. MBI-7]MDH2434339.1 ABC transporter permease subunit [Pokkaliibacter sp. MBI-7]
MATALRPLTRRQWRQYWQSAGLHSLAVLLLGVPLLLGLTGTVLLSLGSWQPFISSSAISSAASSPPLSLWQPLLQLPALPHAILLSLTTGWAATLLSLSLTLLILMVLRSPRQLHWLQRWLAPILAIPHAAMAFGLMALLAPSGWLLRLLVGGRSNGLPPDWSCVQGSSGMSLILALVLKETPFLLLMTLSALARTDAEKRSQLAATLGYPPGQALLLLVWPALYPALRLPLLAVLAYGLSNVDMAAIIGPGNPPTLAVLIWRWLADADVQQWLPASAAALLLLAMMLLSLLVWLGLEQSGRWLLLRLTRSGWRWQWPARWHALGRGMASLLIGLLMVSTVLAVLLLLCWSFSWRWPYPALWPQSWTTQHWFSLWQAGSELLGNSLLLGLSSALCGLLLCVLWLEWSAHQQRPLHLGLWLWLPLLLPQLVYAFGLQWLLLRLGWDGNALALLWAHLLVVLPYMYLSLADSYRGLDPRYQQQARLLGMNYWQALWRVKWPILSPALVTALAVGFAVSNGQYLLTLYIGGGRFPTLTTEAVSLASSWDMRVIGVYAFAQLSLPLLGFALALYWPKWRYAGLQGMQPDVVKGRSEP